MRIAFISYEYPPDTAVGGIGTYVHQAAAMLSKRGHSVEVFAGSLSRDATYEDGQVLVHVIKTERSDSFNELAGRAFAARHHAARFDVLEGPEYEAGAVEAIRLVPDIPLVIKLHTPYYMIRQMNSSSADQVKENTSFVVLAKEYAKSLRRAVSPVRRDRMTDREYLHTVEADEINFPSRSIGRKVIREWGLDAGRASHVPYPYVPGPSLLNIPAETNTNTVTFLGRLEQRKGVLNLALAIPMVLKKHPKAKIQFVGKPTPSPDPSMNMREYLQQMLGPYSASVSFIDPVPLTAVPGVLAGTDICVFPSLWENFPNVCLEAMAAARGIVASSEGGMVDMLDYGRFGRVVSPRSPEQIARGISILLADPQRRQVLGLAARERVLSEYSFDRIGPIQERSYLRAIKHRKRLGPRT